MSTELIHSKSPPDKAKQSRPRILLPIQQKGQTDVLLSVLRQSYGAENCDFRAMSVVAEPFHYHFMYSPVDALCWLRELQQREEEAGAQLQDFCDELKRSFSEADTSWILRQGNPEEMIVQEGDSWGASMVVMVSDPVKLDWRSPFSRSLAERVLRKSRQTVQIIRPDQITVGTAVPLLAP